MKQYTTRCGLCGRHKILRRSHLLPKATYRICAKDSTGPPRTVLVDADKAIFLPAQAAKLFLCDYCEKRFSENGEQHVLSQCLRQRGSFILRDRVEAKRAVMQKASTDVFSLRRIIGADTDMYLYFAASIFWRASATSWEVGKKKRPPLILPQSVQKEMRNYLLGQAPFPKNATVAISIFQDPDLFPFVVFPVRDEAHHYVLYWFCIPGIHFVLFAETQLPAEIKALADTSPRDIPVFFELFASSELGRRFTDMARNAPRKGRLTDIVEGEISD